MIRRSMTLPDLECLDHFVVVGESHRIYIVREFLRYYHEERPHQGLGNVTHDSAAPQAHRMRPSPRTCVRSSDTTGSPDH